MSTLKFIKEFYETFDSDNRDEKLLKYYSRESVLAFSLATFHCHVNSSNSRATVDEQGTQIIYETGRFNESQFENSRNIMRCKDDDRREKLLNKGPVAICHFLGLLPKTEHLLDTFSVDVSIHTPSLVVLTVTGLLYELTTLPNSKKRKTLRCFARTLFITSAEGKILQDDLNFMQPNDSHCKEFIASFKATSSSSSVTGSIAVKPKLESVVQNDKETVLREFMAQTGMNSGYAQQCLEEYAWDAVRAWTAFKATKDAGKIPQIAFT
ncbi:Nuclear RNA export factor [Cichlidogyrus casuarinus]|uniref:Nuclear RNA export factor n=1 Tax=Cichlidogyrus casuarinus TaxID=1844966 RepID=A0ABD2QDX3_9PLAT